MLPAINKYPYFDLSDIRPEIEFPYKKYQPLNPVKTGDYVPFDLEKDHNRWQQFYNGAQTRGLIITKQLLNRPLVVAFYSHDWGDAGTNRLIELNELHSEIRANGGNLLIISTEKHDGIERIAWEHSLSLNFYFDNDHSIAEKFRVYAANSPTWNAFSGIDVNIPLLATYVVDATKQVTYHHIDLNLDRTILQADILSAVYQSALGNNRKRSA